MSHSLYPYQAYPVVKIAQSGGTSRTLASILHQLASSSVSLGRAGLSKTLSFAGSAVKRHPILTALALATGIGAAAELPKVMAYKEKASENPNPFTSDAVSAAVNKWFDLYIRTSKEYPLLNPILGATVGGTLGLLQSELKRRGSSDESRPILPILLGMGLGGGLGYIVNQAIV